MTQYTNILDALEGAGGASREVDALMAKALGWTRSKAHVVGGTLWTRPDGAQRLHVPEYTGSVDQALALVAEKLPGRTVVISIHPDESIVTVDGTLGRSATLPIALLRALFKALSATPEGEG